MASRETGNLDREIGALMRARRIFLGITQTALGEKLGLTFQQIQKYEKGTNRISAARLKEISLVLGVPATYFFQEKTNSADHEISPVDLLSTALNLRMLRAFSQIPDPQLREGIAKTHFVEWNGRPVTSVKTAFTRAVKAAGLAGKVMPHTLRHTAATWLMQNGTPMWQAAGFLGMTEKTLQEVYGHHHPDHMGAAAMNLGRRPNRPARKAQRAVETLEIQLEEA